ncbi:serine hydrolase domain-containing protein [Sphingomonas sp. NIBR02145]|uniref:serine hydrolase domain-containing protein n=1 Tax=Sphingomonas sp. NIBR02145 TaxID=3014784 RepID=UPI0022B49801|nr:serine hydrolase domain-containing protein [Sphingomonas sp. NIBR02145]WHU00836.1 serine hydrolase domain-containing protein [Sphingomonas sp. NIBR02145]
MKLQHVLVAIPLLGVAAPALGQVTVRPQLQVTAQDLRQVSPLELRQRFPAQDQPVSRPYKLRPASSGSWLPKGGIKINQEALAVAQIAQKVKTQFAGKAVGWSVTVMAPGGATATAAGGSARRAPDPSPRAMSDQERITIASVSKTITAATLMRVMAQKNVTLDDKAYKYLPSDWTFDAKFKEVSIRQLLSHTSGIWDDNCGIGFDTLKACAAKAPNINKAYRYANTNYAFQRVMLVRMYGITASSGADYGEQYHLIVNRQTFNSAGMPFLTCKSPQPRPALSYKSSKDNGSGAYNADNFDFTTVLPGQDWGDMTAVCGSQGWNLNSRELAWFMHDLMLTEKILPQATVDQMRDGNLGMFYADYGGGLTAYYHGGYHPAGWNKGEINTLIITYSNGITIGAVINSRYNGDFGGELAAAVKAVMP